MVKLLIILLLICNISANATVYQVGTGGNLPIQNIASMTFNPDDQLLFKAGETFSVSITINQSGTSGHPIIIGKWGTGANPIITGFTTVTLWTNLGSNIWESTNAISTLSTCNMVAVNGVNTAMGRYPNGDAINGGYLTYQSCNGTTSLTSSSLTGTPNWTGAEAVVRTSRWTLDRATINSQSGSTISYSLPQYDGVDGYGFFIQNDSRTLDVQNEWYYNTSTKKIKIYSTSMPTGIQVATIDDLLIVHGSYITIDGITFSGANRYVVYADTNLYNHVTIQNCNVLFSGIIGIYYKGDYLTINNCTISDSNSNGIEMSYCNYATLTNSIVQNTGILTGMGESGIGVRTAVHADMCNNLLIQYNRIINTGYIGLNFYGNSCTVKNNFIDTFCKVTDDGGGIYTYTGGRTAMSSCLIEKNIVINGIGAGVGTTIARGQAHGIYLDDNSGNVDINANTITNCDGWGIFLHDTHHTITYNNVSCYNGLDWNGAQLYLMDDLGDGTVINNNINNNILVANPLSLGTGYENAPIYIRSTGTNVLNLNGVMDYNYYIQISNPNNPILYSTLSSGDTRVSIATWNALTGQDAHSQTSPFVISSASDIQLVYNNQSTTQLIALTGAYQWKDLSGTMYDKVVSINPYESKMLFLTTTPISTPRTKGISAGNGKMWGKNGIPYGI